VEDQPADSGDLTTDADGSNVSDDEADAKAARRRHRMPLRKELAATHEDIVDTATDKNTETAEPTDAAEPVEAEPAPPRRRWKFFRRAAKAPEPEAVSIADEVAPQESEASPTPRTPVGKAARTAKPVTEPEQPVTEPEQQADEQPADEPPADENPEALETQVLVPHRPAGKRLTIAAAAAGVVFVGAAAFAGATLEPYLADRALVHTKLDIARTAANAITTLWTYNPDNMESLPDRSAGYLGGDFANEYRKYIDAIVAPNKQAQVTNTTQVMGTAVETVTPTEATALVYTNSVATSPGSKNIPSLRYLSYRLTMQRSDAKWLITRMSTVTSFDLTPQL
jgi:Mce-associated membrane protein